MNGGVASAPGAQGAGLTGEKERERTACANNGGRVALGAVVQVALRHHDVMYSDDMERT